MKFEILSKEEFKKFADKHPQITFHQTEEWANLKKSNHWDAHYVGLKILGSDNLDNAKNSVVDSVGGKLIINLSNVLAASS